MAKGALASLTVLLAGGGAMGETKPLNTAKICQTLTTLTAKCKAQGLEKEADAIWEAFQKISKLGLSEGKLTK